MKRSLIFAFALLSACASAQDLFLQGVKAEQSNDQQKALDLYAAAAAKDPAMAKAFNNRALILYRQKDYDAALAELDKALTIKPDYAAAMSNRGLVLEAKNDTKGAMAQYEKAVALDPAFSEAYFNAGQLAMRNGDVMRAVTWLQKANDLKPGDTETQILLGKGYNATGNYGKAFQTFNSVLQADPQNRDAVIGSAEASRLSGNGDQAAYTLGPYVASHPDCALCLTMLGAIYTEQKKYDKAIDIFERARQFRPGDPTPRYHLGFLYFLTKNKSKSIENLEEFLKLKGDQKDTQTEKASQMLESLKKT